MWVSDHIDSYEEAARRFLREREFGCVRVAENLRLYLSNLELRFFFSIYIHVQGTIAERCVDGLATVDSDGALCALLPESDQEDMELAMLLTRQDMVRRISGPGPCVRRLVAALGRAEWRERSYLLMRARSLDLRFLPCDARVEVREAKADDLEALLSLQMAYELEELDLLSTRSEVVGRVQTLLDRQIVAIAFWDGRPIGKINTNARGYRHDQIGGFYVKPAYRSRGVGKATLFYLLRRIEEARREAVFFVRPENIPAISLYRRAGFRHVGEYAMSTKEARGLS